MLLVINKTKQISLGNQIQTAQNFSERLLGLLSRKNLPMGQGLYLSNCKSVHTIGMRFPIDILFLDRQGKVIETLVQVKPNRIVLPRLQARDILELAAGSIQESLTKAGDVIELTFLEGRN